MRHTPMWALGWWRPTARRSLATLSRNASPYRRRRYPYHLLIFALLCTDPTCAGAHRHGRVQLPHGGMDTSHSGDGPKAGCVAAVQGQWPLRHRSPGSLMLSCSSLVQLSCSSPLARAACLATECAGRLGGGRDGRRRAGRGPRWEDVGPPPPSVHLPAPWRGAGHWRRLECRQRLQRPQRHLWLPTGTN